MRTAIAIIGLLVLGSTGCDRDLFFEPDDEEPGDYYYGSSSSSSSSSGSSQTSTSQGEAGDVVAGSYSGDIGSVHGVTIDEPRILYYLEYGFAHIELEGTVDGSTSMVFVDTFDDTLSTLEPGTYSYSGTDYAPLMLYGCSGPQGQGWLDELAADGVELEVVETDTPGTLVYRFIGNLTWYSDSSYVNQKINASFTITWAQ